MNIYEISDGLLDFEPQLWEHNIPFDKSWDPCYSFNGGSEYLRILSDGEKLHKSFLENLENMVNIHKVIEAQHSSTLDKFLAKAKEEVCVMPWDEQEQILSSLTPCS